jgi:hypothetical protein
VNVTDDFAKSADALVYYIYPENEEMKIAYLTMLDDWRMSQTRVLLEDCVH